MLTVVAAATICVLIAVRMPFGSRAVYASVLQAATVRSILSTAISWIGLAGSRPVSAKRRIWSTVIPQRLRLPPNLQGELVAGNNREASPQSHRPGIGSACAGRG